jgi:hypothetical protein
LPTDVRIEAAAPLRATKSTPLATLFALPKAFHGHVGTIQRNAVSSWAALGPQVEPLLFGDDEGTSDVAAEFGVTHHPDIARNEKGTPLLDDLFRKAHQRGRGKYLVYVNADIALFDDFVETIAALDELMQEPFLAIGRRTDVDIEVPLDCRKAEEREDLISIARKTGSLAPAVCKDYFVFPRGPYEEIPAFAIGRANWDNWVVASAHERDLPVIDITRRALAVHHNHDYAHLRGGRKEAYVGGTEAESNRRLAGGRNLAVGCAANYILGPRGLRKKGVGWRYATFVADLPRFSGLLWNIWFGAEEKRRVPAHAAASAATTTDAASAASSPVDSASIR